MTDSIVNAMINLLSLAASMNLKALPGLGKDRITIFLSRHLADEQIPDYLQKYEASLQLFQHQWKEISDDPLVPTPEETFILQISKLVREEINMYERIVVFLAVLDFLYADHEITDREESFLDTVAETFEIPQVEWQQLLKLVKHQCSEELIPGSCLVYKGIQIDQSDELEGAWIDRHRPDSLNKPELMEVPGFDGTLIFLFLQHSNSIVLYFCGNQQLSINGRKLESGHAILFSDGHIISGQGFYPIKYRDVARFFLKEPEFAKIVLDGLDVAIPANTKEIRTFNFSEEAGQILGIIASTRSDYEIYSRILAGQQHPASGKITINGYDLNLDRFKLQGIIGYLPENDLLNASHTVYETLYFNAVLSLGAFKKSDIIKQVNKIIYDLDLTDIKDILVGKYRQNNISHLQRKLIHLGLEIIRDPSVLIIDNPLADLTPHEAGQYMKVLKDLSLRGKLIIIGTQHPSSEIFRMLDRIWMIDQGGLIVFQGFSDEALKYFKSQAFLSKSQDKESFRDSIPEPSQISEIIEARMLTSGGQFSSHRKRNSVEWHEIYKKNIESKLKRFEYRKILPLHPSSIPTELTQLKTFTNRFVISIIRRWKQFLLYLSFSPVIAALLAYITRFTTENGYLFSENRSLPIYLFLSVISVLFIGLFSSIREIYQDHPLIARESHLNLSWFSYINSKLMVLFIFSALQAFLFVVVGNMILEIKKMNLVYWMILFSTNFFAYLLGLNLSAGIRSLVLNYFLIPILILPQILLCGALIPFDDLPPFLSNKTCVPLLGDFTASRWAYEALAVSQFKDNEYEKELFAYERSISDLSFKSTYLVPSLQNMVDKTRENESNQDAIAEQKLLILKNELTALNNYNGIFPFEYIDSLTSEYYSENIADETQGYLTYLKIQLSGLREEAEARKDSVLQIMQERDTVNGIKGIKRSFYNSHLAEIVLNRSEITRMTEYEGHIFQKKEPIFVYPISNLGRAHLFAPVKMLNGQYVDTLWFNLSMLWSMIFLLYLTLLTDVLKIFVNFLQRKFCIN